MPYIAIIRSPPNNSSIVEYGLQTTQDTKIKKTSNFYIYVMQDLFRGEL